jgi:hypothetical protein
MFKLVATLLLLAAPPAAPTKLPARWPEAKALLNKEISVQWDVRRHQGRDRVSADPGPTWVPRLTPPLPLVWPPDGKGTYVVYAFAAGKLPSVHDGEEVSAPWSQWLVTGSALSAKELGDLRRLGMQGVRPLQGEQAEVARTAEAAEQAVIALTKTTKPKLAPLVKRYYCQWFFNNAVVSSELQKLHPEFTKWLECP